MRVVKKSFSGYVCEQRNNALRGSVDGVVQYVDGVARFFFIPAPGFAASGLYRVLRQNPNCSAGVGEVVAL